MGRSLIKLRVGLVFVLVLMHCATTPSQGANLARQKRRIKQGTAGTRTKWNINRPFSVTNGIFEKVGFKKALRDFDPSATLEAIEVGCGEGRALLELQAVLPLSKLHCLNHPTYGRARGFGGANLSGGRKDLQEILNRYKINIPNRNLPTVEFGDAFLNAWPYETQQADVVYSSHALTKARNVRVILRETLRVLKPGGEAFLHLSLPGRHRAGVSPPGCAKYGDTSSDDPKVLFCESGNDYTLKFYAVFASTAHVGLSGEHLDPDSHQGVLHVVKERRDCPQLLPYDPTSDACFQQEHVSQVDSIIQWHASQQKV